MNLFWEIVIPILAGYFMYLMLEMTATGYGKRHDKYLRIVIGVLLAIVVWAIVRRFGL